MNSAMKFGCMYLRIIEIFFPNGSIWWMGLGSNHMVALLVFKEPYTVSIGLCQFRVTQ